jgi:hypothetical protein
MINTAKLALVTLAAPVLAALAVGLAGHAAAETPDANGGTVSAADTIGQSRDAFETAYVHVFCHV